jgi:group I intron endonuclease
MTRGNQNSPSDSFSSGLFNKLGMICIYKIQSLIKPDRLYIGSSVNFKERQRIHLRDLALNKHHSPKLQNHYNKYGESDLKFSVLLGCERGYLLKTEQYFLDLLNPYFNVCQIAGSPLGRKVSVKTKEKQRIKMKGKEPWNKGKKMSQEHIDINSKSHLGQIVSNETRLKMSKKRKGVLFTELHKERISKGQLGKKRPPLSAEQKKKISISLKKMYYEKYHSHTGNF